MTCWQVHKTSEIITFATLPVLEPERAINLPDMKMIHKWSFKNATLKLWLPFVLLTLAASMAAQCDTLSYVQRHEQALDMLSKLNDNGILAVRLRGYERQIRELDRLMGADGLSESTYEKLLAKKMSYLQRRESTFDLMSNAFRANYSFSDVVFYYSEDQDDIGDPNALMWLDVSGNVLQDVDIHHRNYFIF